MNRPHHPEVHTITRIGWLRAAVLGANDGIISTASLVIGVAAAQSLHEPVLLAGLAGLVGGAMSMAAGEYVSVSSQADAERAEIERERIEIAAYPHHEFDELVRIYSKRGLDRETALIVAQQLTDHDALAAHVRDELGITDMSVARPLQAAGTSAVTFAVGASLPLVVTALAPERLIAPAVVLFILPCLMALGWLGAWAGKAPPARAVFRVAFWGAAAMGLTYLIGKLAGTVI